MLNAFGMNNESLSTTYPLASYLEALAERFIAALVRERPQVFEGRVMTPGPPPYRRLDCNGRALAYIRVRPRKRAVRIDITGFFRSPDRCCLEVPTSTGAASLFLRGMADLDAGIAHIVSAVDADSAGYAA